MGSFVSLGLGAAVRLFPDSLRFAPQGRALRQSEAGLNPLLQAQHLASLSRSLRIRTLGFGDPIAAGSINLPPSKHFLGQLKEEKVNIRPSQSARLTPPEGYH